MNMLLKHLIVILSLDTTVFVQNFFLIVRYLIWLFFSNINKLFPGLVYTPFGPVHEILDVRIAKVHRT